MKREFITTEDGSITIHLPEMQESYHSKFGAIQEANHVFIQNGLNLTKGQPISVLEIGFGTGLNAFITYCESTKNKQVIDYTGVEAYPVTIDEVSYLNYPSLLETENGQQAFEAMHDAEWATKTAISNIFALTKRKQFFQDIDDVNLYDLIYFDAFGYQFQPDLWSEDIFKKMYASLKSDGILVTYACRTVIKKAMIGAGFRVEKIPGPPGKREMLRAFKS